MKVVNFSEYGDADVLRFDEAPLPEPSPEQVRVRIRAAAVNPADPKWRQGMFESFAPVPFPHILGYDIAGTVDTFGEDVQGVAVGDAVFGMLDSFNKGGYAEYAVVAADHLVRVPASLDFATAAAVPTAALTGVQMTEEHAAVAAGDVVLVTGATGAVGRFALHAARARGAYVVAAVRKSQFDEARALGAGTVIELGVTNYTGPAFNHVIDTVGGAAVSSLCRQLAAGGGIWTAATTPIDPAGLSCTPVFVVVRNDPRRLVELIELVASGTIPVPIAHHLPLNRAAEAHRLVEAGGAGGKVILLP